MNTNIKTLFKNALTNGAHSQVNTRVVSLLGIKEAIVLAELMFCQHDFGEQRKLKNGFFYATNDYLTTSTLLSEHQIRDAVKTLENTWVYMKEIKADEEDVKKVQEDEKLSDEEKKEQINELQKKAEDNFRALIDELKNSIGIIETDDTFTDKEKAKRIVALKRKAGFEKLVETKFTMSYGDKIKWYKVFTKTVDQYIKNGDGSVSMNTIRPDAFIIYNKILAKKVGPSAAIVFSDLLTSYYYTEMCDNLEDGEWFRKVMTEQAERLGITRKHLVEKDKGLISKLINAGLINKKTKGSKNVTYISINFDTLFEILAGCKVEAIEGGAIIKKEESDIERITKRLLARVKEVSGLEWNFNHTRCAFIEQRLEEDINEEDLYDLIKYKYDDYVRISGGKYIHRFNWTNLFGSSCSKWVNNMHNDEKQGEQKLKLEALSLRIIEEVKKVTGIDWRLDESYYPLLQEQLDCGVSEDELVELIRFVYNWKIKNEGKITKFTWNKIYGEFQVEEGKGYSCFATVLSMRRAKNKAYIAANGATYNKETKKFKMNSGSGDNAASHQMTQESVDYQNKCRERGVPGEDVF